MFVLDLHQTKNEINIFEKIISFLFGVCLIYFTCIFIVLIIIKVPLCSCFIMDLNLSNILCWYEKFTILVMVDTRLSKKHKEKHEPKATID